MLATGTEKRVLSSLRLDDPVISTCVAANGTLYVGTMTRLFALRAEASGPVSPTRRAAATKVTIHYVERALEAVLARAEPEVQETPAVGCAIRYVRERKKTR